MRIILNCNVPNFVNHLPSVAIRNSIQTGETFDIFASTRFLFTVAILQKLSKLGIETPVVSFYVLMFYWFDFYLTFIFVVGSFYFQCPLFPIVICYFAAFFIL